MHHRKEAAVGSQMEKKLEKEIGKGNSVPKKRDPTSPKTLAPELMGFRF
jgi:hypothetical protein